MSTHVFGAVLTAEGIAANNRGENAGNSTTLQKVIRAGQVFTTVSAEAIRYAIREAWTAQDVVVNRAITADGSTWKDAAFKEWEKYADNDLLGFMHASKDTVKRRGRLEISRALSTRPWTGDTVFNVASPKSHPKENKDPIPYAAEVHSTRYQYLFALTPDDLVDRRNVKLALDAIVNLRRVAGNHSRFLYDFSPEAIVLRITADPAPRLMYCFDESESGLVGADKLIKSVRSGDVDPKEVFVGGAPLEALAPELTKLGVAYHPGVKGAFSAAATRLGVA